MLDRINTKEKLSAMSSTSKISPVKERNGNLQDRHFHKEFQEEKEESRKKRQEKHLFRPSEMAAGDVKIQGMLYTQNRNITRENKMKKINDNGQWRSIDVLV